MSPLATSLLGALAAFSILVLIERAIAEHRFNRELDRRDKRERELTDRIWSLMKL